MASEHVYSCGNNMYYVVVERFGQLIVQRLVG
jgi:hypothetical protein